MKAESQKYLDRLRKCQNLSERKIINDEFSLYYKNLDGKDKKELKPYFDNLKSVINKKMEVLDELVNKTENILSKYQIAEI